MKSTASNILVKKKKQILETWMQLQLQDESLREDLISNEELRGQSDELLTSLLIAIQNDNYSDVNTSDFEQIFDVLSGISISRAKQGFSPRETGVYVLSLKEALFKSLEAGLKDDIQKLYEESIKISKLMDDLTVATFETFIKGREEVILRQTDEITEISTPVIRVWDGILALPIIG
ncbi:MAG TPA: RsbRD N-terminal domain-containing protein, partial [Cytophagales bacterium]|nr:RsbRD N-terminal domain-containing protein [Cytophagales bacterium]